jgi:phosphotransferase system enzyme I (PtsP)
MHTRGEHVLMATDGLRPGAVGKVRLKLGQGLTGLAASRAEPVNVDNAPAHPAFRYIAATGEAPFTGSSVCRSSAAARCLACWTAQQREQRKYTADEESFLVTLAAQLAGCITQAEIRQALERLDDDALSGTLFLEGRGQCPRAGARRGGGGVSKPPRWIGCRTRISTIRGRGFALPPGGGGGVGRVATAERADAAAAVGRRPGAVRRLRIAAEQRQPGQRHAGADHAGNWAPGALRATVLEYANIFVEMDDPYLRERAADILDLGQRLLDRLQEEQVVNRHYPDHTILMGEEISVSQLLDVPPEKFKGLVSVRGTGTSHVALLARGLGRSGGVRGQQPAAGPLERPRGGGGWLYGTGLHPAQPGIAPGISEADCRGSRTVAWLAAPARSASGNPGWHRLELHANSGLFADIAAARNSGVQGWGCIARSCIFSCATVFPGEEEQTTIYTRVLRIMDPHPVVLRTLDIGGDKPLPYFPIVSKTPFWAGAASASAWISPTCSRPSCGRCCGPARSIPTCRSCFR